MLFRKNVIRTEVPSRENGGPVAVTTNSPTYISQIKKMKDMKHLGIYNIALFYDEHLKNKQFL